MTGERTAAEARFAPVGLGLAVAAVAVNAPRLAVAFLEADGVAVAPAWRSALLGLTGVATATVLTGGGAYLAHAVARRRRFRRLLAATWLLVLSASTLLAAPLLVAGLAAERLPAVLPSPALRWGWGALAVLAVELVAAGAMVAAAAHRLDQVDRDGLEAELLALAQERNALRGELARRAETPAPAVRAARRPRLRPPSGGPVACRFACGWSGRNSLAERGHLRSCPRRPRSAAPEHAPLDLPSEALP